MKQGFQRVADERFLENETALPLSRGAREVKMYFTELQTSVHPLLEDYEELRG